MLLDRLVDISTRHDVLKIAFWNFFQGVYNMSRYYAFLISILKINFFLIGSRSIISTGIFCFFHLCFSQCCYKCPWEGAIFFFYMFSQWYGCHLPLMVHNWSCSMVTLTNFAAGNIDWHKIAVIPIKGYLGSLGESSFYLVWLLLQNLIDFSKTAGFITVHESLRSDCGYYN